LVGAVRSLMLALVTLSLERMLLSGQVAKISIRALRNR